MLEKDRNQPVLIKRVDSQAKVLIQQVVEIEKVASVGKDKKIVRKENRPRQKIEHDEAG
jgi:hypothetical protein